MTTTSDAVRDADGGVMFVCPRCSQPVTRDDFFDLGMRLPDSESREDYCDAELIDFVEHLRCMPENGQISSH